MDENETWLSSDQVAHLMCTKTGRNIMWTILNKCQIRSACEIVSDPYLTAAREGTRFVGLTLLEQLETHQPKLVVLMYQENLNVGRDDGNNTDDGNNRVYGDNTDDGTERVYGTDDGDDISE